MKHRNNSHGSEKPHKSHMEYIDSAEVSAVLNMQCIAETEYKNEKLRELAKKFIYDWAEMDEVLVGEDVPKEYVYSKIFEFYKGLTDTVTTLEVLNCGRSDGATRFSSAAAEFGFLTAISEDCGVVPWEVLEGVALLMGFSSFNHMLSVLKGEIVRFSKGRIEW